MSQIVFTNFKKQINLNFFIIAILIKNELKFFEKKIHGKKLLIKHYFKIFNKEIYFFLIFVSQHFLLAIVTHSFQVCSILSGEGLALAIAQSK